MKALVTIVGSLFLTGCVVTTHVVEAQPHITTIPEYQHGNHYSPRTKEYTTKNSKFWIVEAVVKRYIETGTTTIVQCTPDATARAIVGGCYEVSMRSVPRVAYKVLLRNRWSDAYVWKEFNIPPTVGDEIKIQ